MTSIWFVTPERSDGPRSHVRAHGQHSSSFGSEVLIREQTHYPGIMKSAHFRTFVSPIVPKI